MWRDDDGLVDVTSAFKGYSQPLTEILDDIHRRGWTVTSIKIKDDQYVAEGKSIHGETVAATGRTDATAAGNLLIRIMRKEFMRASSLRERLGAWDHKPIEQQLTVIAMAYLDAPVYDPKCASAWMELAQDCTRRVATIRQQIQVDFTDDPVPYQTIDEMREDIQKKHHLLVTRANSHHPVWNEQQVLDYRTVVDVLGHTVGGADWGWHGTCLAFAALVPLMADFPQKALFTELVGQSAYGSIYRMWGPQKISFLDDLIEKAQQEQNKPGHSGVHPSQSLIPGQIPHIQSFGRVAAETRQQMLQRAQGHEQKYGPDQSQVVHDWPDGWSVRALQTYGDMYREGELMHNCFSPANGEWAHPLWQEHPGTYGLMDDSPEDFGYELHHDFLSNPQKYDLSEPIGNTLYSLRDPDNLPHASLDPYAESDYQKALGRHNSDLKPEYAQRLGEWAQNEALSGDADPAVVRLADHLNDPSNFHESKLQRLISENQAPQVVGQQVDPNDGWQSNVAPLPDNAFMWQRADGQDPLHIEGAQEALRGLEPGLTNMHPALAQQTVVNALRASLLGARKSPMAHAVHYQGVMQIPSSVGDPMAYRDALEQQREQWNQSKGYAPEAHKQYWPEEQQFKQWVKAMNPQLDDGEVHREAQRELLHMLTDEEERITSREQPEQLTAEQVEHEAFEAIRRRLKAMTKPSVDQKVDFGDAAMWHQAANEVRMLPADEFMNQFEPGEYEDENGDADWESIVDHPNFMAPNPFEPNRIHAGTWPAFVEDIRANGVREPVVTDWYNPEKVVEGHHRVVAASLTGQPIPYVQAQSPFTISRLATHHADMYPSYLVSQLKQLAHVSRHAKRLGEAAQEDLINHKGHGHHFRAEAMSLGIPGLTPRHLSTAWLHLAPQTSQLGIIDPHVMETLGHDWLNEGSTRDYFKHERELAAGRDAAGYNHIPLGQFSAALWDHKVGGPDWHPDRSPTKAYMPTPYSHVDWNAQTPAPQNWPDDYWWNSTQEARDKVAQDFDRGIGVNFNRNDIPWSTRYAMAERTGNPELDAAIAQFMLAHKSELGDINDFRHPMVAYGQCQVVAEECAAFLKQRGFNAYAEADDLDMHPGYENAQPSESVMTPEGPAGDFTYPEHCVVTIYNENHVPWWSIDFTAAQYGFNEFPKVEPGPDGPLIGPQRQSAATRTPWVMLPGTTEKVPGSPGMSLMQHVKNTFNHPTVQDVWAQDYEAGKS